MIQEFTTHTGEIITGHRLTHAFEMVAKKLIANAKAIRSDDDYAAHVTEQEKDEILDRQLERAERVRQGIQPMAFWLWQLIDTELTGECVPLLPQ